MDNKICTFDVYMLLRFLIDVPPKTAYDIDNIDYTVDQFVYSCTDLQVLWNPCF